MWYAIRILLIDCLLLQISKQYSRSFEIQSHFKKCLEDSRMQQCNEVFSSSSHLLINQYLVNERVFSFYLFLPSFCNNSNFLLTQKYIHPFKYIQLNSHKRFSILAIRNYDKQHMKQNKVIWFVLVKLMYHNSFQLVYI